MQKAREKVRICVKAVDAGLVVTDSSGKKPDKQDISSSSGNYITQAVDADIGPVNDEEPFAEGRRDLTRRLCLMLLLKRKLGCMEVYQRTFKTDIYT
ncbi:hypothetical protein Tco_1203587 [Tanacetum coccineum]